MPYLAVLTSIALVLAFKGLYCFIEMAVMPETALLLGDLVCSKFRKAMLLPTALLPKEHL